MLAGDENKSAARDEAFGGLDVCDNWIRLVSEWIR